MTHSSETQKVTIAETSGISYTYTRGGVFCGASLRTRTWLSLRNSFVRTGWKLNLVLLAGLLISPSAYAYLDPNAGGLIFQILTPILAVATAAMTFAGRRIYSGMSSALRAVKYFFNRVFRPSSRDFE